jgi:hypothetical protein
VTARRPLAAAVVFIALFLVFGGLHTAQAVSAASSKNFQLIGKDPLFSRGMNAAPALYTDTATDKTYVYVGNRTDGQPQHPHPGVLIVEVTDPSAPRVVGEIGKPNEANIAETSRELRVWPQQRILMVMNFQCSAIIHACLSPEVIGIVTPTIKFYDLADPVHPSLLLTYVLGEAKGDVFTPHEMYLWVDPNDSSRALLYLTSPKFDTESDCATMNPAKCQPNLIVTDLSGLRAGTPHVDEVLWWNLNGQYEQEAPDDFANRDVRLHSIGVTADGTRTYLAYLGGGFFTLDTTQLAQGVADPQVTVLNSPLNTPRWDNQTVHSAVKVPGRPFAYTTDEVYGTALNAFTLPYNRSGCPWGWVHLIDVSDEAHPQVVGSFQTAQNKPGYCLTPQGINPLNTTFTSYSAHNPTLAGRIAFNTWHSDGLLAIDLQDLTHPVRAGYYSPAPLRLVTTEDPALSLGLNKVVMWSYPIINDGLIYVIDIRNGLYILKYTGPGAQDVQTISFLEGNSNLGDAAALGL